MSSLVSRKDIVGETQSQTLAENRTVEEKMTATQRKQKIATDSEIFFTESRRPFARKIPVSVEHLFHRNRQSTDDQEHLQKHTRPSQSCTKHYIMQDRWNSVLSQLLSASAFGDVCCVWKRLCCCFAPYGSIRRCEKKWSRRLPGGD